MTDFSLIALATQYSFSIAFSGMAAGALYFLMERNNLTPAYSPVASLAAMVSLIAAINYFTMRNIAESGTLAQFPTELRYIDWILTTPLLLAIFPVLLGGNRVDKGMLAKLMVADLLMIAFGYVGEIYINRAGGGSAVGWIMFLLATAAWFYILYVLFAEVGKAAENADAELRDALHGLRSFVVIGWAIYPIGYLIPALGFSGDLLLARELVYGVADLINKVGFGMIAVGVARKLSLKAWEAQQPASAAV